MRHTTSEAKDTAFIAQQHAQLVNKYEAELETLRGRLAQCPARGGATPL